MVQKAARLAAILDMIRYKQQYSLNTRTATG